MGTKPSKPLELPSRSYSVAAQDAALSVEHKSRSGACAHRNLVVQQQSVFLVTALIAGTQVVVGRAVWKAAATAFQQKWVIHWWWRSSCWKAECYQFTGGSCLAASGFCWVSLQIWAVNVQNVVAHEEKQVAIQQEDGEQKKWVRQVKRQVIAVALANVDVVGLLEQIRAVAPVQVSELM